MRAITRSPRFLAAAQQSPKKSAPQELALPVERHFGLIESQYPGDAHQDGVHFQAGPIVRPLLDV